MTLLLPVAILMPRPILPELEYGRLIEKPEGMFTYVRLKGYQAPWFLAHVTDNLNEAASISELVSVLRTATNLAVAARSIDRIHRKRKIAPKHAAQML